MRLTRVAVSLALCLGLAAPAHATTYAVDFVANAASGTAMNEAGDVVGYAYAVDDCGPWCLPAYETVAWVDGVRTALPTSSASGTHYVTGLNVDGWISGYADYDYPTALVWKPTASGYEVVEIGALPDTTYADTMGIDDFGRVLGWSTTGGAIPTAAGPFVWSEADGMQDLTDLGFPNEDPWGLSPGGTVATQNYWYSLDDPSAIYAMSDPPRGYLDYGYGAIVNDAGEQARFLITTSSSNLLYAYRYHTDDTWEALSSQYSSYYSGYGLGSIDDEGDVTATIFSAGVYAEGPDGTASSLSSMVSTAYPSASVTWAGDHNAAGEILAQFGIGRSYRLVKLVPVTACTSNCLRVSRLTVRGRFVQDPADPGRCTEGGIAYNSTTATVTVTTETGAVVRGAAVYGRFLDDYYTDSEVSGTTNARGQVTFTHVGNCGVGAVAFLVEDVVRGTRTLDRTTGTLTGYSIPR